MINNVVLVGRITKDPDLKYTTNNIPVSSFTLAVNRRYKNDQGETEVDFIQCVAWRKQSENLVRFVRKGNLLGIQGSVQTRSYEDTNGQRKYVTEILCDSIQFLESKKEETQQSSNPVRTQPPVIDVEEDDLPF